MHFTGESNNSAGYWGEPNCDLPMQTLLNLMEHLNDTQDQVGTMIKNKLGDNILV